MDESLTKIRHERSKKDFPGLTLQEDEYVEFAFKRAQICLFGIIGGTIFALVAILLGFLLVLLSQSMLDDMGRNFVFIILASLLAASVLIGLIATIVYKGNRLFITNKRVIQWVMDSPVSRSVNVIDLPSIEDASYHQNGLLQTIFHFGTLRLATVGDETSYTFKYSDISREDLEAVTKLLVETKKRHTHKKSDITPEEDAPSEKGTKEASKSEE